jgi:type I site-specific restriction-modification system R (restriction) subunit
VFRVRRNLRQTINAASSAAGFLIAILGLCKLPAATAKATLAIDAPLGFPAAFAALITGGAAQPEIGKSATNPYLYRFTERRLVDEGITALSAVKDKGYAPALITKAIAHLTKVATDQSRSLYDINRDVYDLLRYGVKVKADVGEQTQTVWLIDWKNPTANHFAIAEEVAVKAATSDGKTFCKRPDVVIYVNGIALGVLELKRSTVSVSEGIRQNLDNQKPMFIQRFFTTMQMIMAGNDTEGLRYGLIESKKKYWLSWREENPEYRDGIDTRDKRYLPQAPCAEGASPLDYALVRLCAKDRFLEMIHNFLVFDAGAKKTCRHNQYFGVRTAQEQIRRREGGIIWHTQGSGKSLTMVWLAKWIWQQRDHLRASDGGTRPAKHGADGAEGHRRCDGRRGRLHRSI